MQASTGHPLHQTDRAPFGLIAMRGVVVSKGCAMGRLKVMGARIGGLPAKVKAQPKVAEQFYSSPEWRALVARRRRDFDYQVALARGKPGERVILDHVVERKDGGADLDPMNTQWLTNSEHQAKTAKARAARAGRL